MKNPLFPLAVLAAALPACDEGGGTLKAFKVSDRAQLIGGPGAIGQVGDYMIENDQIRAVVLGPRTADHSAGPGIFGGGLADIDLVRTEERFRRGQGLDSFAEMFPLANLKFQDPPDLGVEVISDGGDEQEARVRVTGRSSLIFQSIGLLFDLAGRAGIPLEVQGDFCFRTDYVVKPGKRVIIVETTMSGRPSGVPKTPEDPDPCSIPPAADGSDVLDLDGLVAADTAGVFDVVLGADPSAAGPVDGGFHPGVIAGDFLYFGHTTSVFAPGVGFDKDQAFFEVSESGTDTFSKPLSFPAVIGDGVNEAFVREEGLLITDDDIFPGDLAGAVGHHAGGLSLGETAAGEDHVVMPDDGAARGLGSGFGLPVEFTGVRGIA